MKESVWSPLKIPVYRSFWICAFLSNLGTWIQDIAASWVMTHLNSSPLVISLLSFSASLPLLLLSIPAGYVADLGYRRQILLFAQGLMFCAASVLTYLVWRGQITEVSLILLSLCLGVGVALTNPAFQSVLTDLVPSPQQASAVMIYYMGINLTRVLGPTVGGGLLSGFGATSAFLLNSISFLGLIVFFWRWPVPAATEIATKKKISVTDWYPLVSGPNLRLWLEIFAVTFFASSLWALYPSRGRVELALSSWQYGSLMGFLGLGACFSAVFSAKVLRPERSNKSLAGSYLVYAVGILILAGASSYAFLCLAMFFAGSGWLVLATLMNVNSRQVTGASPLKATMLGVFMAVFYAGMALGSITWGAVATLSQASIALSLAGAGLISIGLVKSRAFFKS